MINNFFLYSMDFFGEDLAFVLHRGNAPYLSVVGLFDVASALSGFEQIHVLNWNILQVLHVQAWLCIVM